MTIKLRMMERNFMKFVVFQLFIFSIILPRVITAEEVSPEEFVVSKNKPKEIPLISLPKDFFATGDQDTDCCALVVFVEVKDISNEDDNITETGIVTVKFVHPNIRNDSNTFNMEVKEEVLKEVKKVRKRHTMNFDNCSSITQVTFGLYATIPIMDKKDVKLIMVTGKDDGIECTTPTTTVPPPTPPTTQDPPMPQSDTPLNIAIGSAVTFFITTLLLVAICIGLCYKYNNEKKKNLELRVARNKTETNTEMKDMQIQMDGIERVSIPDDRRENGLVSYEDEPLIVTIPDDTRVTRESQEDDIQNEGGGRGTKKDDDNTENVKAVNDEKFEGGDNASPTADNSKESKESFIMSGDDVTIAAGSSQEKKEISRGGTAVSDDVNIAAGSVIKGKPGVGNRGHARGKDRGIPKEEETNENIRLSGHIAYFAKLIKDNPLLLFTSIAAGLFFIASIISTVICVFLFQ